MQEKVELKEKIAAVDQHISELWDALDETNQKLLKSEFFILNRYISNVEGQSTATQEHFVLTVNEYFNKDWNLLQKHPKLVWQLLCMCSHESKKTFFHQWIGFKKKQGNGNKKIKFLAEIYPSMKMDEIEMTASLMTDKEIKELAKLHGMEDSVITKKMK